MYPALPEPPSNRTGSTALAAFRGKARASSAVRASRPARPTRVFITAAAQREGYILGRAHVRGRPPAARPLHPRAQAASAPVVAAGSRYRPLAPRAHAPEPSPEPATMNAAGYPG